MKLSHLVLVLVLSCAGCRTIETRTVASTSPPAVRIGARTRAWEVRQGEDLLGRVILFQERGLASDSVYVVRNAWNQDVGMIDGLGRAFRYLPHLEEPAWVGSGTIMLGAQRILGSADCTLIELGDEPAPGSGVPTLADDEGTSGEALEPAARPSSAPLADGGLPQSR